MILSFGVLGPESVSLQLLIFLRLSQWNQCTKAPNYDDNE